MFKMSGRELKSVRIIVICGLLIALGGVLEAANPFNMGDLIKIRFDFVATALIGYFAGPVGGALVAAMGDMIRFLLKPVGDFFPGYTLSAFVGGAIYGLFLYRNAGPILKKDRQDLLLRCFLAKFFVNLVVNIGLNTLWISKTMGKAFWAILPMRILKNAAALPLEIAILFFVMFYITKYLKKIQS